MPQDGSIGRWLKGSNLSNFFKLSVHDLLAWGTYRRLGCLAYPHSVQERVFLLVIQYYCTTPSGGFLNPITALVFIRVSPPDELILNTRRMRISFPG